MCQVCIELIKGNIKTKDATRAAKELLLTKENMTEEEKEHLEWLILEAERETDG